MSKDESLITICNSNSYYKFNFIGDKDDIKDEKMFSIFDTNYINTNNLPIIYYPLYNNDYLNMITNNFIQASSGVRTEDEKKENEKIKNEFEMIIKEMSNEKLSYNRYTILPVILMILLVWIFIIMFILKYIHYHYNIYYIYIITSIIIALLIFGSLWFLYVSSELS